MKAWIEHARHFKLKEVHFALTAISSQGSYRYVSFAEQQQLLGMYMSRQSNAFGLGVDLSILSVSSLKATSACFTVSSCQNCLTRLARRTCICPGYRYISTKWSFLPSVVSLQSLSPVYHLALLWVFCYCHHLRFLLQITTIIVAGKCSICQRIDNAQLSLYF